MGAIKAFLAGFVSTLVFHQGMLSFLYAVGVTARAPYSLTPTAPPGVPSVLSLAFWGGLWGVLLWRVLRPIRDSRGYWLLALAVGAVAPSLVALFVVLPLKGQPLAGGWDPVVILTALFLNGTWGIGVAVFCQLFGITGPRR